ncbi:CYFA0S06e05160g1_1, partial [Cyberlindnera fabianii]
VYASAESSEPSGSSSGYVSEESSEPTGSSSAYVSEESSEPAGTSSVFVSRFSDLQSTTTMVAVSTVVTLASETSPRDLSTKVSDSSKSSFAEGPRSDHKPSSGSTSSVVTPEAESSYGISASTLRSRHAMSSLVPSSTAADVVSGEPSSTDIASHTKTASTADGGLNPSSVDSIDTSMITAVTSTSDICLVARYETATQNVLTVAPAYDHYSSITGWTDSTTEMLFITTRCLESSEFTSISYFSSYLSGLDVTYVTSDLVITFISTSTLKVTQTSTGTLMISTASNSAPATFSGTDPVTRIETVTTTGSNGLPSTVIVTEIASTSSAINQGYCAVTNAYTSVDDSGSSVIVTKSSTVLCVGTTTFSDAIATSSMSRKTITDAEGNVHTLTLSEEPSFIPGFTPAETGASSLVETTPGSSFTTPTPSGVPSRDPPGSIPSTGVPSSAQPGGVPTGATVTFTSNGSIVSTVVSSDPATESTTSLSTTNILNSVQTLAADGTAVTSTASVPPVQSTPIGSPSAPTSISPAMASSDATRKTSSAIETTKPSSVVTGTDSDGSVYTFTVTETSSAVTPAGARNTVGTVTDGAPGQTDSTAAAADGVTETSFSADGSGTDIPVIETSSGAGSLSIPFMKVFLSTVLTILTLFSTI